MAVDLWRMPFHEFFEMPEATRVPGGSILAWKPEDITEQRMQGCTQKDLVLLARVMGIPHSGRKAKLIARIVNAHKLRELLRDYPAAHLKIMPARWLKSKLKSVGAFCGLNRYGLAQSLIGWRNNCRLRGRQVLAEANHYLIVKRAVLDGLDVPANVLESYPDLADPFNRKSRQAEA
jgi:hypothetical protein